MKIFHYSSLDYWPEIASGWLRPSHRLWREFGPAFNLGAVFWLLEARPNQWIKNKHFPESWWALYRSTGRLLLEIEIDPGEVYIIERWHVEGFLYGNLINPPEIFRHNTLRDSEKAYFDSIIPLKHYLDHQWKYDYSLPEILMLNRVPMERVTISGTQQKLEEAIEWYRMWNIFRKSIIRRISEIPWLEYLYDKYKSELEDQFEDEMTDIWEHFWEGLK